MIFLEYPQSQENWLLANLLWYLVAPLISVPQTPSTLKWRYIVPFQHRELWGLDGPDSLPWFPLRTGAGSIHSSRGAVIEPSLSLARCLLRPPIVSLLNARPMRNCGNLWMPKGHHLLTLTKHFPIMLSPHPYSFEENTGWTSPFRTLGSKNLHDCL